MSCMNMDYILNIGEKLKTSVETNVVGLGDELHPKSMISLEWRGFGRPGHCRLLSNRLETT